MTVTANVDSQERVPAINLEDVLVKSGNEQLTISEWVPAREDRAGLRVVYS